MQRALALGRLGMSLSTVRAAPLRAAAPLRSPAAAARRPLRVLASANSGPNGPSRLGGSGSAADEALAAQRRRLILQSLARQHSTLAGAEAAAASGVAGGQQRRGMLRRLLLSGAAAVALLTAAVWPRPAAAFQGPAGMFGGRPPVVEAVPVTMENKVGFWCTCIVAGHAYRSAPWLASDQAERVDATKDPHCQLPPPPVPCRRRFRTCRSCRPMRS